MLFINHHNLLFRHIKMICLYWIFLNCMILRSCESIESFDSTASSLILDDSIDPSPNTVQNSNQLDNNGNQMINSTGIGLMNSNEQQQKQGSYYLSASELSMDNETNSNPIVISNNVSTNKQQQIKPNSTYTIDNRLIDTMNSNENVFNYLSSSNGESGNGAGSNLEFQNQLSSQQQQQSNSSVSLKSNKILPNQYEYLNLNNLNSANQASSSNKMPLPNQSTQIDDLIEFRLNGSTSFSKFLDKQTSQSTLSTPNNQITQTPSTTSTTVLTASEPTIDNSLPELYAPLSSLSSFANIANSIAQQHQKLKQQQQQQQQQLNSKLIVPAINTIPKNMPLSNNSSPNQSMPSDLFSSPNVSNTENRLRWINNYNRNNKLPAYPPKQPSIPGIPSGFRNPIITPNTLPPSNNGVPSGMINGVSTPPLNPSLTNSNSAPYLNPSLSNLINSSGTNGNSNNNLNLASIVNSLSAPNNIHQPSGFGGSSLNPTGFPFPTANNLIGPPSIFATSGYPPNINIINSNLSPEVEAEIEAGLATATHSFSRRPGVNITRVEHIAAECSDDYMKVIINFNGTFTGLVYSSGYVHDANCIYVNGTGRNGYEFYIRLNQCGTMGREEMHHPKRPGEVRRRDQVMWNTLSIQYNGMIEEEYDEHYRVTCEYGSDYWKTVTFPTFNVEVNTGSPVVFTINPPQCQMEVRRGFGIAGSRTSGPVTVGDPLTLLIHMKSEKAGFDILVKNCISHNGGTQRLQLIDTNGCVTNEKLISPFRGTYNSDDGHQVTLYAYLKAFRFTGSPALYLECDIHMCHNRCPPSKCYWRNLSKRSTRSISNETFSEQYGEPVSIGRYNFTIPKTTTAATVFDQEANNTGVISESLSLFQALEVRHSDDMDEEYENSISNNMDNNLYEHHHHSKLAKKRGRKDDSFKYLDEFDDYLTEQNGQPKFCFTSLNLSFISMLVIAVLISAISTSILSCLRLRKLRIDYLRYDDRLSAISKSTSTKTGFFNYGGSCSGGGGGIQQTQFSRRY